MGNSVPSRKGREESELTAKGEREGGAREVLSAPVTADPSSASSPSAGDGGAPPGTVGGEGHVADGTVKKKKICCACPETKKLRDECVALHGETSCEMLIEAHKRCLRSEGFAV